jgi:rhodanese-related sulfurtransferase
MDQVIEFIGNHPLLVLATAAVTVAIIVTEGLRLRTGSSSLEPSAATLLHNREDALFVDIRNEADFRTARLPGAVHLPAAAIAQGLDKLKRDRSKPLIIYCNTGMQTGRVAAQLKKLGFDRVYQLRGGLASWQSAGYPVDSK